MIRQTARRVVALSAVILGASAAFVPSAFAAENGGNQSGTMDAIETVSYTPNATGFTITPGTDMTAVNFGSVNVRSNANAGWTLEVKSLNNAALKHATLTDTIAYSLFVDGAAVTITAADTYVATGKDPVALTCSAVVGCDYPVVADIAGTASDGKASGVYTDTITFRLTNK